MCCLLSHFWQGCPLSKVIHTLFLPYPLTKRSCVCLVTGVLSCGERAVRSPSTEVKRADYEENALFLERRMANEPPSPHRVFCIQLCGGFLNSPSCYVYFTTFFCVFSLLPGLPLVCVKKVFCVCRRQGQLVASNTFFQPTLVPDCVAVVCLCLKSGGKEL